MRWHHQRKHYHKWVLLPKCPFALCDVADHNQNDLFYVSIDIVIQPMKIEHAIASELE